MSILKKSTDILSHIFKVYLEEHILCGRHVGRGFADQPISGIFYTLQSVAPVWNSWFSKVRTSIQYWYYMVFNCIVLLHPGLSLLWFQNPENIYEIFYFSFTAYNYEKAISPARRTTEKEYFLTSKELRLIWDWPGL